MADGCDIRPILGKNFDVAGNLKKIKKKDSFDFGLVLVLRNFLAFFRRFWNPAQAASCQDANFFSRDNTSPLRLKTKVLSPVRG